MFEKDIPDIDQAIFIFNTTETKTSIHDSLWVTYVGTYHIERDSTAVCVTLSIWEAVILNIESNSAICVIYLCQLIFINIQIYNIDITRI